MKLPPHARSVRFARPARASSLGASLRSLAASSAIHLLVVLLLTPANPAGSLVPGARRTSSGVVSVRGHLRRPSAFASTSFEAERSVESTFVEPDEFDLVEASPEPMSDVEFFDEPQPSPAFETVDPFAGLLTTTRFVLPAVAPVEEFGDHIAALERSEPEPEAIAVAEEVPDAGGLGDEATEQSATIIVGLPPAYPKIALRMGWEGTVVCSIEIDSNGRVASVTVAESSGYEALDEAALEAIRGWKFEAGRIDGEAARTSIEHKVHFEITA